MLELMHGQFLGNVFSHWANGELIEHIMIETYWAMTSRTYTNLEATIGLSTRQGWVVGARYDEERGEGDCGSNGGPRPAVQNAKRCKSSLCLQARRVNGPVAVVGIHFQDR